MQNDSMLNDDFSTEPSRRCIHAFYGEAIGLWIMGISQYKINSAILNFMMGQIKVFFSFTASLCMLRVTK